MFIERVNRRKDLAHTLRYVIFNNINSIFVKIMKYFNNAVTLWLKLRHCLLCILWRSKFLQFSCPVVYVLLTKHIFKVG